MNQKPNVLLQNALKLRYSKEEFYKFSKGRPQTRTYRTREGIRGGRGKRNEGDEGREEGEGRGRDKKKG